MPTTQLPPAALFSPWQKDVPKPTPADKRNPTCIVDEINAYIAIRDSLLAEAEQIRTAAKLDSVIVANDFVENCLRPPRPAYRAQHLPEAEAVRERARCQVVRKRVSELRRKSA